MIDQLEILVGSQRPLFPYGQKLFDDITYIYINLRETYVYQESGLSGIKLNVCRTSQVITKINIF